MKRTRTKDDRRLCLNCRLRRARFLYRGRVKHDPRHALCFRCYRAVRDAMRMHPARSQPLVRLGVMRPPALRPGPSESAMAS
jgi:hypothetical protein